MNSSFRLLVLNLNIFIIVPTGSTGLQTCAKVLQMQISGGGGAACLQPKRMKLLNYLHLMSSSFWLLVLEINLFIIVATGSTGLQTCAKVLQMQISGGGGTACLQPKSSVTSK